MKISYFNYIVDIAGISVGAINKSESFVGGLRRLGHQVEVNYLEKASWTSEALFDEDFRHRNPLKRALSPWLFEPRRLASNLRLYSQEKTLIEAQRPDVILERLNLYTFMGAYLARRHGIPLVVEADSPCVYEYRHFYGKDKVHIPWLPDQIERYTLSKADGVIAISEILKQYYVDQGIDADKIAVVPNGADPEQFHPMPRSERIRARFPLEGKTVIGWVGSLFGWSGIDVLLDLIREMNETRPDVGFLLVGGGQSKAFFQRNFPEDRFKNTLFLPGVVPFDQVNDYLSCMDIVLAPYPKLDFWYASSMKIFEYMAAGKALVATGIGQINDIIQDGENGFLLPPDEPGALRSILLKLLDDPELREQAGREARASVLAHHTWDMQARKMAAVFERAARRG